MTWNLIASAHAGASGSLDQVTTSAIDTSGAKLLVLFVSRWYAATGAFTITDTYSNTWTQATLYSTGSSSTARIVYAVNPTVGSGHTVTWTNASGTAYPAVCLQAWDHADTTSPFDVENGANTSSNTIQPGSVTPGQNDSLIITGFSYGASQPTISINSGFTISDHQDFVGGSSFGADMAYFVQATAAAINPTWDVGAGGVSQIAAAIAVFKPSSAAAVSGPLFGGGALTHGALLRGGRLAA